MVLEFLLRISTSAPRLPATAVILAIIPHIGPPPDLEVVAIVSGQAQDAKKPEQAKLHQRIRHSPKSRRFKVVLATRRFGFALVRGIREGGRFSQTFREFHPCRESRPFRSRACGPSRALRQRCSRFLIGGVRWCG